MAQCPIPAILSDGVFTNTSAYFLGAVLATNESYRIYGKSKRVWLATVKHNVGQCPAEKLQAHEEALKTLGNSTKGQFCSKSYLSSRNWFTHNKDGFAFIFETDENVTIRDICAYAEALYPQMSVQEKECLLLGAFDGRGSIDVNKAQNTIRYIVLDCNSDETMDVLIKIINEFHFGYNSNFARDRLEGGETRKPQLRIAARSALAFAERIGFISPLRMSILQNALQTSTTIYESSELPGRLLLKRSLGGAFVSTRSMTPVHAAKPVNVAQAKAVSPTVPVQTTQMRPVVPKPSRIDVAVGDQVKHKAFGRGTIVDVPDPDHIVIQFTVGLKTFLNPGIFTGGFATLEK